MPGPMEKTRAGGNGQLENESPAAADPLLQDIAKMKKLQADIEAKALLERKTNKNAMLPAQQVLNALKNENLKMKKKDNPVKIWQHNLQSIAEYNGFWTIHPCHDLPRVCHNLPHLGNNPSRLCNNLLRLCHDLPRLGNIPPRLCNNPLRLCHDPPRLGNDSPRLSHNPLCIRHDSLCLCHNPHRLCHNEPRQRLNRSPVREDHLALPLLRLPLLSPLRIPQEFLPTRPPVAPPRVRTLDPFDDPERDSILHKPLFVSDESDSDDMTENNDTSDKNGNSDSDLSDTNIYRPKKRAREKSSARKTNAKKGKPSDPEYFVETKLFTCKLCNQVFTSKRGFNIHKTRIHNEIIATEVASVSADRRKGTEKKKTNANQRKRPEKKKNANQPKVELLTPLKSGRIERLVIAVTFTRSAFTLGSDRIGSDLTFGRALSEPVKIFENTIIIIILGKLIAIT
ncbi:hypothetical protein MSG28_016060 [Choristoneura fumiferana]|uniref:Uncharacterized protein n=1 Tax=Choristoneura fumiferana TaxID=7141 RepID=A0ACC0K5Y8_CHOFU|nr:hypothetical protein MSG28_016060 [Choristoneura fumiferana]